MNINGFKLIKTCSACPEQYDVFKDGVQVGYLRLRHGYFYASVPNCSDNVVYQAEPNGDGCFNLDEREFYLTEAVKAITAAGNKGGKKSRCSRKHQLTHPKK
jgi:hypothetical protein